MARSALEKFMHGAATAGAKHFENMTFLQIQSDLTMERDNYLAGLRGAEADKQRAHQKEENRLQREADTQTPQAQLAHENLADRRTFKDLVVKLTTAKTPEEKNQIREQLSMLPGGMNIGGRFIYGGSNGVYDKFEQKFVDPPDNESELLKLVVGMARDGYKGQVDIRGSPMQGEATLRADGTWTEDGKKPMSYWIEEATTALMGGQEFVSKAILAKANKLAESKKDQSEGPAATMPPDQSIGPPADMGIPQSTGTGIPKSKVWGTHEGRQVREGDILATMATKGWSRKRTFEELGIEDNTGEL